MPARKATVTKEVKNEDVREIREAMLVDCPSKDCRAQINDHEVRLRKVEINEAGNKALMDSIIKMTERNEETSKATVDTLGDISRTMISIDNKVNNLVEKDQERAQDFIKVDDKLTKLKGEFYEDRELTKIDTKIMWKNFMFEAFKWLIGGGGLALGIKLLSMLK